jgi:hypothetical protein
MEYPERDCLDGSSSKALRATIAQQQADIEALVAFAEARQAMDGFGVDSGNERFNDCWERLERSRAAIQPIIERYRAEETL